MSTKISSMTRKMSKDEKELLRLRKEVADASFLLKRNPLATFKDIYGVDAEHVKLPQGYKLTGNVLEAGMHQNTPFLEYQGSMYGSFTMCYGRYFSGGYMAAELVEV